MDVAGRTTKRDLLKRIEALELEVKTLRLSIPSYQQRAYYWPARPYPLGGQLSYTDSLIYNGLAPNSLQNDARYTVAHGTYDKAGARVPFSTYSERAA